jgi:virginiamycin B lyase
LITAGPDGALWFTEQNANKIGRLTTSGAFTEYAVPTAGSFPNGITAGPDGALWFTEAVANKIGGVTTSGAFTEYAVPTPGAFPLEITAGPDRALWFTENTGDRIGRIAPVPTSTAQCKHGGWRNFPQFKNQGDCVSFVEAGK